VSSSDVNRTRRAGGGRVKGSSTVLQSNRAVDAHGFEQPAVVGDEQERAVEGVERLSTLLDRAGRDVRGSSEHETVRAAGP